MRVEFINSVGGKMLVDESRVEEYKAAGYMLAADIIEDTTYREIKIDEPKPAPKKRTKKTKEV